MAGCLHSGSGLVLKVQPVDLYMALKKHLQHGEQLQFCHGYGRNEEGQWPHLYGMKRLVQTMLER